jgi:hypothetical protein
MHVRPAGGLRGYIQRGDERQIAQAIELGDDQARPALAAEKARSGSDLSHALVLVVNSLGRTRQQRASP